MRQISPASCLSKCEQRASFSTLCFFSYSSILFFLWVRIYFVFLCDVVRAQLNKKKVDHRRLILTAQQLFRPNEVCRLPLQVHKLYSTRSAHPASDGALSSDTEIASKISKDFIQKLNSFSCKEEWAVSYCSLLKSSMKFHAVTFVIKLTNIFVNVSLAIQEVSITAPVLDLKVHWTWSTRWLREIEFVFHIRCTVWGNSCDNVIQ